jgi:outer membrane protein TolC
MKRAGIVVLLALVPSLGTAQEDKLPAVLDAKPMEAAKGDDELHKLLTERYNAALDEARVRYRRYLGGNDSLNDLEHAARRLLDARLAFCTKEAERVPVYEQHLELARQVERLQKARHDAGQVSVADWDQARFRRLDLEIRLLRAKKAAKDGSQE